MSLANAIIYHHPETVSKLLENGADCNELDEYGYTPLIESAIANHTDIAKILLARGARVNDVDMVGSTALHWAVENHNLSLSQLLLEHGANPNAYTRYGQPLLVKPLLRRQQELKELLYRFGGDLKFAQDYINTKLLAHRFELTGRADIIDTQGKFVEIDRSGFILEFTLSVILGSLLQFMNNYAARHLREHFDALLKIVDAYSVANELIRYQQYLVKVERHTKRIDQLLNNELLLLPIGSQGHAITLIKYKNFWAKCDRGENSLREPSVIIYRIGNPRALTKQFLRDLLYKKHSQKFIHIGLAELLELHPIANLPIPSQITGNCSWANVEAALPTMLFLLENATDESSQIAVSIYNYWKEWDKDRALHDCIENFYSADSSARKASIATLLAAILFQACRYNADEDLPRINKIMSIFSAAKEYQYILKSYLKIYTHEYKTEMGNNFVQLLDLAGGYLGQSKGV